MNIPPYLRTPTTLILEGRTFSISGGWRQVFHHVANEAVSSRLLPDAYKVDGDRFDPKALVYCTDGVYVRVDVSDAELFARTAHLAGILYVNGFLRAVVGYIDGTTTMLPDPADTAK